MFEGRVQPTVGIVGCGEVDELGMFMAYHDEGYDFDGQDVNGGPKECRDIPRIQSISKKNCPI